MQRTSTTQRKAKTLPMKNIIVIFFFSFSSFFLFFIISFFAEFRRIWVNAINSIRMFMILFLRVFCVLHAQSLGYKFFTVYYCSEDGSLCRINYCSRFTLTLMLCIRNWNESLCVAHAQFTFFELFSNFAVNFNFINFPIPFGTIYEIE